MIHAIEVNALAGGTRLMQITGPHAAKRREAAIEAIEAERQRMQGLITTDDDQSPEGLARRVQHQAGKKRAAQRDVAMEVVTHADRPRAPDALHATINEARVARDAALDGVSLLGAGGPAAQGDDARRCQAWKGPDKVEHCLRLTNALCLCGPVFLKTAQRMARLLLVSMVGCLAAGVIARQIRRGFAERHEPMHGLMPEGRDTLQPTGPRLLRACADDRMVLITGLDGRLLRREFARPNPVVETRPRDPIRCGDFGHVAVAPLV